jgi:hypothetical protein
MPTPLTVTAAHEGASVDVTMYHVRCCLPAEIAYLSDSCLLEAYKDMAVALGSFCSLCILLKQWVRSVVCVSC